MGGGGGGDPFLGRQRVFFCFCSFFFFERKRFGVKMGIDCNRLRLK